MIFSPRISLRNVGQLCRRAAIAYEAGLDARSIWAKEAQRAGGAARRPLEIVSRSVAAGDSLSEAFFAAGNYFPPLMGELIAVAEQTGRFDAVFKQLAENYQEQLQVRRQFLATIAWPMIQLGLALGVIGLFIWISGFIRQMTGSDFDPLGWGLYGAKGVVIYLLILAALGGIIFVFLQAVRRGAFWIRPVQRFVLRVPLLGGAVNKILLARLTWSLYLTFDAGMEIRRAVRISLHSTNHATYLDPLASIDRMLEQGNSLHESFLQARCFPRDLLDAVAVGEESGRLAETFALQNRQYRDQARSGSASLAVFAGIVIWVLVAALIIYMIFHLFVTAYLQPIQKALAGG
ncbi:MAG: type II secretion system F family protein [Pirellulales bacterium]|nr:type II secretion system F family protein [Pirellulales bacterium]